MNHAKTAAALSLAFGALFIWAAVALLAHGNLHEDAYILFQYAKNVAAGAGIVFDRTSGPAEGATDFLWMMSLALLHKLGLRLGTAAALVNGMGLAAICWVIFRFRQRVDLVSLSAVLLVSVSGGCAAALGGFSTLAYGGLFAFFAWSLVERRYLAIGLLAIAIPLFRPDGVLLVLGGLLALVASSDAGERKRAAQAFCPAMAAGAAYFLWRYHYFGLLLPLPLIVKSKTDTALEGLLPDWEGVRPYLWLLAPLVCMALGKRLQRPQWRTLLRLALGPAMLLLALGFAHQSQNIGHRFQFPAVLALILVFVFAAEHCPKPIKLFLPLLAIMGLMAGSQTIDQDVHYLTNDDYINAFPQILKREGFVADHIAVTEAGRFPFWYDAPQMVDLIGLNSVVVVKQGAAYALDSTRPDLIFVHQATRFDISAYDRNQPFILTSSEALHVVPNYAGKNPVGTAPVAALAFAQAHHYRAVLVQYGKQDKDFSHVYFLAPTMDVRAFTAALAESRRHPMSYDDSDR